MKNILKTINKYSWLAVLFTTLAYIISVLMESYEAFYINTWIYNTRFLHLSLIGLSLVVCAIVSVIFGMIAVLKIYRKKGAERWVIGALTLWNLCSLAYVLMVWGSYPYRI